LLPQHHRRLSPSRRFPSQFHRPAWQPPRQDSKREPIPTPTARQRKRAPPRSRRPERRKIPRPHPRHSDHALIRPKIPEPAQRHHSGPSRHRPRVMMPPLRLVPRIPPLAINPPPHILVGLDALSRYPGEKQLRSKQIFDSRPSLRIIRKRNPRPSALPVIAN